MRIWIMIASIAFIFTFMASQGIQEGISENKLYQAHQINDAGLHLVNFHSNLSAGVFYPIWASLQNYGYGDPSLGFLSPSHAYVMESFFLITQNPFYAIYGGIILLFMLAALGMANLFHSLFKNSPFHLGLMILATGLYVLNPYVLKSVYIHGSLEELMGFACLPWLVTACMRATHQKTAFFWSTLIYALCILSNEATHFYSTLFIIFCGVYFKSHQLFLTFVLGNFLTAFHWLPKIVEQSHLQTLVDLQPYPWFFDVFAVHPFFVGTLFCLALYFAMPTSKPIQNRPFLSILLWSSVCCLFLGHHASRWLYELHPLLKSVNPHIPLVFLSTAFTLLTIEFFLERIPLSKVWFSFLMISMIGSVLGLGSLWAQPQAWQALKPEHFAATFIEKNGISLSNPALPKHVQLLPSATPIEIVSWKNGLGEKKCERRSPVEIECEVFLIRPTWMEARVLDYPRWQAYSLIEENKAWSKSTLQMKTNPLTGTSMAFVPSGKQKLIWKFEHTPLRKMCFGIAGATAALILIAILFMGNRPVFRHP